MYWWRNGNFNVFRASLIFCKKKKKSQKYCKTNNGFPCVWCDKRKKAHEKGDNSRNEFYEAMCEDGFKKIKERYEK